MFDCVEMAVVSRFLMSDEEPVDEDEGIVDCGNTACAVGTSLDEEEGDLSEPEDEPPPKKPPNAMLDIRRGSEECNGSGECSGRMYQHRIDYCRRRRLSKQVFDQTRD